jgi:hypothetical protein
MAEQFIYKSVLASYMNQLLNIKTSAGISALRMKWILKEIDDFASSEELNDLCYSPFSDQLTPLNKREFHSTI